MAVLLLFSFQHTFAQTRIISGKVTTDQGAPVANASVVIKGTSTGTVSEADGTYKLSVPASAKIIIFSNLKNFILKK